MELKKRFGWVALFIGACASPPGDPMMMATTCTNTCVYAGDGECDDGGAGARTSLCGLGTDCVDCGARAPLPPPDPMPECIEAGGACAYSVDCCGDLFCLGLEDRRCRTCNGGGSTCLSADDCCSGACRLGYCD